MKELFTIGYSTHSQESFIAALKAHEITAIADVRSSPYSRFKPEFDKEHLGTLLKKSGIEYVFLGDYCGAKPDDSSCFIDGRVSYDLLAKSDRFIEGLKRLDKGLERYRIALMCAEKDPITCHRMILVARQLHDQYGATTCHILGDGTAEAHEQSERRLLRLFGLDRQELPGLGQSVEQRLADAYRRQGERIAFTEESGQDKEREHG